jgi:Exocyst complex component Sec5
VGPPRTSGSLKSVLAAQLGMCIASLKAGKQDQVLRMSLCLSPFHTSCSYCFLFSTAHSGGHDVWNVVFDMVKNVSEVMMSTLPNFWKIAKGFLDGKYRKVRFHCFPKVWSTDTRPWRHRTHPRSFHDEVHLKFGLWLTRLSSFTYLSSLNSSSFRIWQ